MAGQPGYGQDPKKAEDVVYQRHVQVKCPSLGQPLHNEGGQNQSAQHIECDEAVGGSRSKDEEGQGTHPKDQDGPLEDIED